MLVMAHHHPAGITRQAPGRFRGDARALLEDGLPGLIWIRQRRGIDMDHHLVALAWRAGIELVMQRRLRQQGQGIGLLLGHGGGRFL